MAFLPLFIVLAISVNQGAARPAYDSSESISSNSLASSEGASQNSDGEIKLGFPTSVEKGLMITINGTLNTNDKSFIVELPSVSGDENCQINFNFGDDTIYANPSVPGYDTQPYNLSFSSESEGPPTFTLKLTARELRDGQPVFATTFAGEQDSDSAQLMCKIKNFDDINQIVIKAGVAHVHTLQFDFESNH